MLIIFIYNKFVNRLSVSGKFYRVRCRKIKGNGKVKLISLEDMYVK